MVDYKLKTSYYDGRKVFLTGATGFVGSALISKLISSTPCTKVIALVRGGERRFWSHIDQILPEPTVIALRNSRRIDVIDGDLTKENFGLSQKSLTELSEASIIIHAASSINLVHPLPRIAQSVVYPTLNLAELALASDKLERFVYISTAYSNAHLHSTNEYVETMVNEEIYPLERSQAEDELEELQATGSTRAFEATDFPYPYSYAKHLTERLLTSRFQQREKQHALLVVRPSVIGPALAEPCPYHEIRGSAPATGMLTALVLCPSLSMTWASPFDDPASQSTIDEVPVDVVVNRIIIHTAMKTQGCVHAVAGGKSRRTFGDIWEKAMQLRALPWKPSVVWRSIDWKSDELHPIASMFRICGTSFLFDQSKTVDVWDRAMTDEDKVTFPLFLRSCKDIEDLEERKHAVKNQISWYFGRRQIPQSLVPFCVNKAVNRASAGNFPSWASMKTFMSNTVTLCNVFFEAVNSKW